MAAVLLTSLSQGGEESYGEEEARTQSGLFTKDQRTHPPREIAQRSFSNLSPREVPTPWPVPPQGSHALWDLLRPQGSWNFHELVSPPKSLWRKASKARSFCLHSVSSPPLHCINIHLKPINIKGWRLRERANQKPLSHMALPTSLPGAESSTVLNSRSKVHGC